MPVYAIVIMVIAIIFWIYTVIVLLTEKKEQRHG
jgi:cbb3-type cytochrome oxidase subunit 3